MVFLKNHLFNASPWWKTHGALRLKKRQISAAKTFVAATRGRTAARPPRGCKWWKLRCSSTKRSQIWGTQKWNPKNKNPQRVHPKKSQDLCTEFGEATILPQFFLPQNGNRLVFFGFQSWHWGLVKGFLSLKSWMMKIFERRPGMQFFCLSKI